MCKLRSLLVLCAVSGTAKCGLLRQYGLARGAIGVLLLASLLFAPIATADSIQDVWAPTTADSQEINLYEIYNNIFGTSYTESNAIPQASSDEVFDLSGGSMTLTGEARFAGLGQQFGFYQPTDLAGSIVYTPIFDVQNPNSGWPLSGFSTSISPSGEFGFYILAGGTYWHSQSALNWNGENHMVMLATSDPYTFLLGFEDLDHMFGDQDYNDLVIRVAFDPGNVAPVPASLSLLGTGMGLLLLWEVRRRKAS